MISILFVLIFTTQILLPAANVSADVDNTAELTTGSIFSSIDSSVNVLITSIASKKDEKISDAPGVISVITQDQLQRYGNTTLGDILKRVPSFIGTTIYLTERSAIASRGDQIMPSSSHILLLINGRPMREILEGGMKSEVYESFPVSVIERIEIIRGPGSVLYGSQAVSAVINVVTKKPEHNSAMITGMLGDALRSYVMADLEYKIGKVGLVLAGRYADKGTWDTKWKAPGVSTIYTNKISIPDYGPGAYAEMNYRDNKFLNLRCMASYCEWSNHYFVPDYQFLRDVPGAGVFDVTGRVTWKKLFGDVAYSLEALDKYKLNANITYTQSWFTVSHYFPGFCRNSYEVVTEVTNVFTPNEQCNIVAGVTWGFMTGTEKDRTNDSLVYNDGHQQNTFSGYSQIDYHWDLCKIIGGIQVNKVADFKADVNPRAGLILYPLDHINIKILYSTAFRAPSLNELYLDGPEMKGSEIGVLNPEWPNQRESKITLEPEKIHTIDAGVNLQNEKVQYGINAFHSRMKNLIVQDRSGRFIQPTYNNFGEVNVFGLECESKYRVSKSILFEASFLYQQSKDRNTGEENVTPLPNFSIKGGLSYHSDIGLTISLFNTFQQALDPKYSSDLNPKADFFNMTHCYCCYDFSQVLGLVNIKKLMAVLSIDNLLDEEIWLPAWGLKNGSTIPYNEGRKIYAGFTVSF